MLARDMRSDRPEVIKVLADDVTIDLQGHAVIGAGSKPDMIGIAAAGTRRVTIRNGRITGCAIGLFGQDAVDLTVEDVDFTNVSYLGINRGGRGLVVRRCMFVELGGYADEPYAVGINGPGQACLIEHNQFRHIYRQTEVSKDMPGEGVGVVISAGDRGCVVRHNWFENAETPEPSSIGIFVSVNADALIENNVILDFPYAVGSQSPVRVVGNLMVMRYFFNRAIAIHMCEGGTFTGNIMVGYETPKTTGLAIAQSRLLSTVPELLA
jgi:hypothetical protein